MLRKNFNMVLRITKDNHVAVLKKESFKKVARQD